jgi:hypothetical protein
MFTSIWTILVSVLSVLLPLVVQVWLYIDQKKRELRDRRFETFHRLIRELVEGSPGSSPRLDHQIAIVFELRNFPEYAEVSQRILEGLIETWSVNGQKEKYERLFKEIRLTLEFLAKRRSSRWFFKQNGK